MDAYKAFYLQGGRQSRNTRRITRVRDEERVGCAPVPRKRRRLRRLIHLDLHCPPERNPPRPPLVSLCMLDVENSRFRNCPRCVMSRNTIITNVFSLKASENAEFQGSRRPPARRRRKVWALDDPPTLMSEEPKTVPTHRPCTPSCRDSKLA